MYHINWGWGGSYDGYYAVADEFDDTRTNGRFGIGHFIVLGLADGTTSIMSLRQDTSGCGDVFNLQGRKVGKSLERLPRGIYIKDSKKVFLK